MKSTTSRCKLKSTNRRLTSTGLDSRNCLSTTKIPFFWRVAQPRPRMCPRSVTRARPSNSKRMTSASSAGSAAATLVKNVAKRRETSRRPLSALMARSHVARSACSATVSSLCAPISLGTRPYSRRSKSKTELCKWSYESWISRFKK